DEAGGLDDLERIRRRHQHLRQKLVRVESDRREQRIELILRERLRRRRGVRLLRWLTVLILRGLCVWLLRRLRVWLRGRLVRRRILRRGEQREAQDTAREPRHTR